MTKKAVHFGAGNIGRGFVACFLHEAGYRVVFADVVDKLVDSLNAQSSYNVVELGTHGTTQKTITNYTAINSRTEEAKLIDEIATADVLTCSVGPRILQFIAPVIAKGLAKRSLDQTPLAIIACENMINNTANLAGHIKDPKNTPAESLADQDKKAIYANSAVDRIVPDKKGEPTLDVQLELFYEWVVESAPFTKAGVPVPEIPAIHWVENLDPYIERKLYTVNTSHATAAYYGYNRGKPTIHDAMADASIREAVAAAISETAAFIVKKHGVSKDEQDAYKNKILDRISNPNLDDSVRRVGREPLRKLGRRERLIGPAASLAEEGMETTALLAAAEMAFRFQGVEGDKESVELAKIMAEKKPDDIVQEVCGLETSHPLYAKVKAVVEKVQADGRE
ncbi:mannitol-1-phosphate 5-dehydrogenase [Xylaria sp. CBS 124048]|nr:mannitol-1-phosphate 5-dehydrogenase [Xylaria sp. CBS 124048]